MSISRILQPGLALAALAGAAAAGPVLAQDATAPAAPAVRAEAPVVVARAANGRVTSVRIGDVVAVFAQGPIGLCATAGARLKGASRIFAIESVAERAEISRKLGAEVVIDHTSEDPVAAIMARELRWDEWRTRHEIAEVDAFYRLAD